MGSFLRRLILLTMASGLVLGGCGGGTPTTQNDPDAIHRSGLLRQVSTAVAMAIFSDDWVKEGPHLMIVVPNRAMLEGLSTDPNDPVYVMWKDTPYAHIMLKIAAEPVDSYDGLLGALRGYGSTVDSVGPISQPFFVPEGQLISVDGHKVQVFEFSNEEDAQSAAETISPDGSSIGTSMISWVEAPHFYNSGKLIVLYVGQEDAVVDVLKVVLGPKFAGR